MQQQLFLHIGDCKTGSTAIQTMLADGLCTPQGVRLYPGHRAPGLARSLGDRPNLYPARWQGIARRLAETEWDIAVLSSELFEFIQPQKLVQALRAHLPEYADAIKVIVYVRPHCGRVLSQYAENLNLGHETGSLEQSVDHILGVGRLQYSERLARWKDQFGDRLIVRPFLRDHLVDSDVRRDFLAQILGDTPYSLRDGVNANVSLTLPDLALMRFIQRRFGELPDTEIESRVAFGKQFAQLLHARPSTQQGDKLRLPRMLYDQIYQSCVDDAREMDAQWVAQPCFVAALEQAGQNVIDTPQSLEAEDYHSPETLRQTLIWADLIQRQMADSPIKFGRRLRPKPTNPLLAP